MQLDLQEYLEPEPTDVEGLQQCGGMVTKVLTNLKSNKANDYHH